jgi:DNA integrity scanning protein DisA with diadenylate cyclase activity
LLFRSSVSSTRAQHTEFVCSATTKRKEHAQKMVEGGYGMNGEKNGALILFSNQKGKET